MYCTPVALKHLSNCWFTQALSCLSCLNPVFQYSVKSSNTFIHLRMVDTCSDVLDAPFSLELSKGRGCELWAIICCNGTGISFTCEDRSQECQDCVCSCSWSKSNFRPLTEIVNEGYSKSAVISPTFKWANRGSVVT